MSLLNIRNLAILFFALLGLTIAGCSKDKKVEEPQEEVVITTDTVEPTDVVEQIEAQMPEIFTVHFGYDDAAIADDDYTTINNHSLYLKANPAATVSLQGHCDERGTQEYNMALGERRAQSVYDYLILQGVQESQLTVVSYGETRPVATGSNDEAYRQNRRVEFVY